MNTLASATCLTQINSRHEFPLRNKWILEYHQQYMFWFLYNSVTMISWRLNIYVSYIICSKIEILKKKMVFVWEMRVWEMCGKCVHTHTLTHTSKVLETQNWDATQKGMTKHIPSTASTNTPGLTKGYWPSASAFRSRKKLLYFALHLVVSSLCNNWINHSLSQWPALTAARNSNYWAT